MCNKNPASKLRRLGNQPRVPRIELANLTLLIVCTLSSAPNQALMLSTHTQPQPRQGERDMQSWRINQAQSHVLQFLQPRVDSKAIKILYSYNRLALLLSPRLKGSETNQPQIKKWTENHMDWLPNEIAGALFTNTHWKFSVWLPNSWCGSPGWNDWGSVKALEGGDFRNKDASVGMTAENVPCPSLLPSAQNRNHLNWLLNTIAGTLFTNNIKNSLNGFPRLKCVKALEGACQIKFF